MTERTIKIKGLISGQVDMGTFGLVELELLAIEKEMEEYATQKTQSLYTKEQVINLMKDACACGIDIACKEGPNDFRPFEELVNKTVNQPTHP